MFLPFEAEKGEKKQSVWFLSLCEGDVEHTLQIVDRVTQAKLAAGEE